LPGVEPEDFKGDIHGGLVETSQLLALHPEWVDSDYKELPRRDVGRWLEEKGEDPRTKPGGAITALPAILDQWKAGLQYFSEESYSGQPAKASAELGEQILDTLAGTAAQAMAELLDGSLAAADCHSPVWKLRHVFLNGAAITVADWILDHPKTVG
ncbi:MAG: creatininase family protein, partial [bacterium]|nr:creatininase family protein [bacterium]